MPVWQLLVAHDLEVVVHSDLEVAFHSDLVVVVRSHGELVHSDLAAVEMHNLGGVVHSDLAAVGHKLDNLVVEAEHKFVAHNWLAGDPVAEVEHEVAVHS